MTAELTPALQARLEAFKALLAPQPISTGTGATYYFTVRQAERSTAFVADLLGELAAAQARADAEEDKTGQLRVVNEYWEAASLRMAEMQAIIDHNLCPKHQNATGLFSFTEGDCQTVLGGGCLYGNMVRQEYEHGQLFERVKARAEAAEKEVAAAQALIIANGSLIASLKATRADCHMCRLVDDVHD